MAKPGVPSGGAPRTRSRTPIKLKPGVKHGVKGYAAGCGCDTCLEEKRELSAYYRARKNGTDFMDELANDNVTPIRLERNKSRRIKATPPEKRAPIGDMERSVIDECDGLSLSHERPAMVAQARVLSRILDNPKQAALHPTTSRQLTQILNDLRGNSKKRTRSRLASVQRMVTPTDVAK